MKYLAACLLLSIAATALNLALWWSRPQAVQPVGETLEVRHAYDAHPELDEDFKRAMLDYGYASFDEGLSNAVLSLAKTTPEFFNGDLTFYEKERDLQSVGFHLSKDQADHLFERMTESEKRPLPATLAQAAG